MEPSESEIIINRDESSTAPMDGRSSIGYRIRNFFQNVTVEPSIFLFIVAFGIHGTPVNTLWIDKICRVTLKLNHSICSNYSDTQYEEEIIRINSSYSTYSNLLQTFPSAVYAAFLGAWSDKHGRRFSVLSPTLGFVIFYVWSMLCIYFADSPTDLFLGAFLPWGIFGGIPVMMMGCLSYVSDLTNDVDRTVRLSLVEAAFFIGLTIGNVLGSIIQSNYGYYASFLSALATMLASFFYTLFWVKESLPNCSSNVPFGVKIKDFFDWRNLRDCLVTTFKKREGSARLRIYVAFISCTLYAYFQVGESFIFFLYTNYMFNWSAPVFGIYSAFIMLVTGVSLLVTLPILDYVLHINDHTLGILGASLRLLNAIIVIVATQGWILYLATAVNLFCGGMTLPIRAVASKSVSAHEIGKIYAMLAFFEGMAPLLATVLYPTVFSATLTTFPAAVFAMTGGLCVLVLILFVYVFIDARRLNAQHRDEKFI